jgi:deoxyhypusine synthase
MKLETDQVKVTTGIDEQEQQSSFQNATLQSANRLVAMSIATNLVIEGAAEMTEVELADKIVQYLDTAAQSIPGLSFEVQVGPSIESMQIPQKTYSIEEFIELFEKKTPPPLTCIIQSEGWKDVIVCCTTIHDVSSDKAMWALFCDGSNGGIEYIKNYTHPKFIRDAIYTVRRPL